MKLIALLLAATLGPSAAVHGQDLAVVGALLYVSPQAAPRTHTTILIRHGKIAAIGGNIKIPKRLKVLECARCVVFAGFWNAHVHFTGTQWVGAANLPAPQLTRQVHDMLTRSGFTTVVDTGSDPQNTSDLRRRVDAGEVLGPHIYTAGSGLYPPNGIPFYLADLPESVRAALPQPSTPLAAIAAVHHNIVVGADLVKLFTGSYVSSDYVIHMPVEVARAAVLEGHKHSQLVFAHPSDREGIQIAVVSGVDVLAHAPDMVQGVDQVLLKDMVDHQMAMIPTLKLFSGSDHIARIREIVTQFHALGGVLMFGTDTGFLTDYDVSEEYRQLTLAGLSFRDALTMLTTTPASKFKVLAHTGTVSIGKDGDLTILASDPATGQLTDFAHVLYTIRAGRVIFDGTGH